MTEGVIARTQVSPAAEGLVWSGVAMCLAGLVGYRLWEDLPAARFGEALLLAGLCALLAWPLARRCRMQRASALATVSFAALVALSGPGPVLAVGVLVGAAAALGALIVGDRQPAIALACGLALIAGLVGWLLPLPLHRAWLWGPLLLAFALWRRRSLYAQWKTARCGWRDAVTAAPRAAMWSVALAGLASAGTWLPTMQYDDLAYHLGLPWQLMTTGRYAPDPSHQVWALAPWASDVLHGIVQLLARTEGRGPLNGVWLALTCAGLWKLGGALGLSARMRWAAIALFASLPLTTALLAGMQTETAAGAVMVLLAVLIMDTSARRGRLWAGAVLFGLLWGLKLLHGLAALPLLGLAIWRYRGTFPVAHGVMALLLALAVAGSSYSYAWLIAGNPVLPLFNGVFDSPYFLPGNFSDARWQSGFDASLAWDMTFDTRHYLEGWDGGIGFVLVALAGAVPLALANERSRALMLCSLAAMVMPLAALQYARYMHPGLVLALPALLAGLARAMPERRSRWLLAGLCVLNLAYQGNAHWMLHTGAIKRYLGALGRDASMYERYVPERILIEAIRTRAPGAGPVLLLSPAAPAYAELGSRGRTVAWYAPRMEAARIAADADASGQAWARLFRREGITGIIVRPADLTGAQRSGLHAMGARCELVVGDAEWWRVPAAQ